MRITLPNLPCWANNSYLDYVRPHIEAQLEVSKYHSSSSSTVSFKKVDQHDEKKDYSPEQKSGELNDDDTEEELTEIKIETSEDDKTTGSIDTTKHYQVSMKYFFLYLKNGTSYYSKRISLF